MADVSGLGCVGSGLPWASGHRENQWFAVILGLMIAAFSLPAVMIPIIDLPDLERATAEKIPPQLAKLLQRPEPSDPMTVQPLEDEPVAKAKLPREEVAPVPAPVEQTTPKSAEESVAQSVEAAREKASHSGLLAMKDRLAALRTPSISEPRRLEANVGNETTIEVKDLAMDTNNPPNVLRGSGGIEEVSRPVVEAPVAAHTVKKVDTTAVAEKQVANAGGSHKQSASGRGDEERAMSTIRRVFDAQKAALYSLYRRELRQDPTLEGKVTLELVIEPDGSVSDCRVIGSELANPSLEQRIAMRVRLFDFGAENVGTRRVRFPIDFLPG